MAFIDNLRFPTGITRTPVGGPMYSTQVVAVAGGAEQRNARWAAARRRYEVGSALRTEAQFAAVRECFEMARGRLHSFRFKDWADYRATTAEGNALLVSGSVYQLRKRYGSGAYAVDRVISKLVSGRVLIYRNGAADITGATTIDAATGRITVTGHTGGDVYTWSGEFDVPVRFDADELRASVVDRTEEGLLLQWESVPLVEVPFSEATGL